MMILNQQFDKQTCAAGSASEQAEFMEIEPPGEDSFFEFPDEALNQSVVDRFEYQVMCFPNRVAVRTTKKNITYDALNKKANRLANYILKHPDTESDTIVLFLGHGLNTITGMLGVLKTGKLYVPIDTSHPEERVADILDDSGAKIIITDTHHHERIRQVAGTSATIVDLDAVGGEGVENPGLAISPDRLAYILYTSGSTGKPKGVMQNHRNFLHIVKIYTNDMRITKDDILSFVYSHGFAAGVKDIFGALLNGGSVCPFDVREKGVVNLPEFLIENRVTIYHSVPTVFRHLCKEFRGISKLPDIRLVSLGSEPVTHRDFELYRKYFSSHCYFHIELGSTETGVIRQYFARHDSDFPKGYVNLGYPVTDKEIVLLKVDDDEAGDDRIGEIGVRSDYLSPGYWNRPRLTEEMFNQKPDRESKPIYRTGDLGRFLPGGCLEYLGRKDFQVKVMGQRVDILGMESLICELDTIEDAVVVPFEDRQGNTSLAAYCVPSTWPGPVADDIRKELFQNQDESVAPAIFEMIRFLPLTSNGKVNRSALKESVESTLCNANDVILPQSKAEKLLTGFFIELLSLEKGEAGITQNFFQMGGNSLAAVQLCARITEAFGTELQITDIFDAPTVSDLQALLVEYNGEKDTVEYRAETYLQNSENKEENREDQAPVKREIYKREHSAPAPLSYFQQSIWFLQQANINNPFYNWTSCFRMSGALDTELLRRSFAEVVNRHESLRTTFAVIDDALVQCVSPEIDLPFGQLNFSGLPDSELDKKLKQKIEAEARHIFDLGTGPLLRVFVIKTRENEHCLLVVIHHIICDGWSMGLLFDELSLVYEALNKDTPLCLNEPELQYADFAAWQKENLRGDVYDRLMAYWKNQLSGIQNIDLSTDFPRPSVPEFNGAYHRFTLPEKLVRKLDALGRKEGKTMFMVLLSIYKILLYRYTGQDDIAVGVPFAARKQIELESVFGLLANAVVLRSDFSDNPGYLSFLDRLKTVSTDAYANQSMPFETLVKTLNPKRELSHNPLFQVSFEYENFSEPIPKIEGLDAVPVRVHNGTSKFDITLNLVPSGSILKGYFEYNADLFNETTIIGMAEHLKNIAEDIISDPGRKISDIAMLGKNEERKLIYELNRTKRAFSEKECVHHRVEAQCRENPDKVAVVFEDLALTYGELNAKANRLAHHLLELGFGPEKLAGIYIERSLEMIVSLLAVLKAGGAYVPLDPSFPNDRLEYMADDSGIFVLLTQSSLVQAAPKSRAGVICVDTDPDTAGGGSDENPVRFATGSNLAYVIYTSGSTGKPKGVQIAHTSVVNFLNAMKREPGLSEDDILLSVTTLSFDISVLEIFLPLCVGARLVLANREEVLDGELLSKRLVTSGATVMQATPASFRILADEKQLGRKKIKALCGGEPLPRELADKLLKSCESLWNMYGPTETTIWSTIARVTQGPVLAGYPIDNTTVYILDNNDRLAPPGVPGELCIGGIGLARGYLNRENLTSEKFIPAPFNSNERIYRTGDLARRLSATGEIEVMGRFDNQVKIRGFRIELGEIETLLSDHSEVKEAVVTAMDDSQGVKMLVSYIIPEDSDTDFEHMRPELRSYLKKSLPDYMVPSVFWKLDAFPLTPNKKIDRKSLPVPDMAGSASGTKYVAPVNEAEKRVSEIWKEVLGLEVVGRDDNFFDLGGHSLLVVNVHKRLKSEFKKKISVIELFKYPTVRALAGYFLQKEDKESIANIKKLEKRVEKRRNARVVQRKRRVRK